MDAIDRLLNGAIDLHCHSGPSPMPRRINHVEAARSAASVGMRAIAVKCHYHDTVTDLLAMRDQLAEVSTQVFGGVCLNSPVGGLNPHAVDLSLKLGGRIIWFPTISSRGHLCHAEQNATTKNHFQPMGVMQSDEVSILREDGDLRPEVHVIIGLAKESGALITTGHLLAEPALVLLEACAAAGVTRVMVQHPNYIMDASPDQVQRFTELGAIVEHGLGLYDESRFLPFEDLLTWLNLIGPEHSCFGSDLGQVGNPLPIEAYRRVCAQLLDSGFSEKDIRTMIATNTAKLIGLDD